MLKNIKDFFLTLIKNLQANKYLNSTIILCLDTFVSIGASLFTVFLASIFFYPRFNTPALTLLWVSICAVISLAVFLVFRTHKMIIRHTTLRDIGRFGFAGISKGLLLLLACVLISYFPLDVKMLSLICFDILWTVVALVAMRVVMVFIYGFVLKNRRTNKKSQRILIYGTGTKGASLVTQLQNSEVHEVVGFIKYGPEVKEQSLMGKPINYFETEEDLKTLTQDLNVDSILFAHAREAREEQDRLIHFCADLGIKILIAPSISEAVGGKVMNQTIREIRVEDLLGRDEIKINIEAIKDNFAGKVVMVTGAAGSIGSELCRQLAGFGVKQLVLFDNAETPMHNLRLELEERFPELDFVPVIGDVRLVTRLDYAFSKWRPQVVFHAAAYKHVPLMEENPCESVLVNVVGSRNIADKCIEYDVEMMVMVSTDKAVNPTNIMGCTKRLAEIYVQSLGLAIEKGLHEGRTKFVTTRFGNVLGSNGSVIPRFREQIAKGGPITVTHPDITRFFMTIPEACRLVMEAATMSTGNQIFVFDMGESVKIAHLAKRMIELAGLVPGKDIEIEYTGLRPGEKLYEEVLSNTENTIPTEHSRIRIAKVREYDYDAAAAGNFKLEELSRAVVVDDMVKLMKEIVPEFKSKNSRFEQFDIETESTEK